MCTRCCSVVKSAGPVRSYIFGQWTSQSSSLCLSLYEVVSTSRYPRDQREPTAITNEVFRPANLMSRLWAMVTCSSSFKGLKLTHEDLIRQQGDCLLFKSRSGKRVGVGAGRVFWFCFLVTTISSFLWEPTHFPSLFCGLDGDDVTADFKPRQFYYLLLLVSVRWVDSYPSTVQGASSLQPLL